MGHRHDAAQVRAHSGVSGRECSAVCEQHVHRVLHPVQGVRQALHAVQVRLHPQSRVGGGRELGPGPHTNTRCAQWSVYSVSFQYFYNKEQDGSVQSRRYI